MKRLLLILPIALLLSCCGGSADDCKLKESDCPLIKGDVVEFKIGDKEFVVSDVDANTWHCECRYEGYYFDDTGEREEECCIEGHELIIPDSLIHARELDAIIEEEHGDEDDW